MVESTPEAVFPGASENSVVEGWGVSSVSSIRLQRAEALFVVGGCRTTTPPPRCSSRGPRPVAGRVGLWVC